MSHIAKYEVGIKQPNPAIFASTIDALAKTLNAKVVEGEYQDEYVTVKAEKILVLPNGRAVGINIKPVLHIVGDSFGWKKEFDRVVQLIKQTYLHHAVLHQLQQMGYKIRSVKEINGNIVGEVVA